MRILFLILSFSLLVSNVYSQQEKQADTTVNHTVPLIKANKADLLNNIDVIFNTQIGLNNNFEGGNYTGSSFEINQFRFEVKGKVYKDKVFFRFRDRYTRDPETQSVDNISHSTDLAFIGYKISDRTSIAIGKMTANWGGYEFDMNPIDIYQYNDIVDNSDNFLTGVQFNWTLSKNHVLSGQILNSRTKSFTELYENVPDVEEAKFPACIHWKLERKFSRWKI
ncbi:porin [Flavobacterium ginsengisoli]|uniref:porin n=1 Tax=Flavobacterium ginsengisoli TaxID=871694 RepID=UPI002414D103|nr:porin [Flavobacterium ginsengisoli]